MFVEQQPYKLQEFMKVYNLFITLLSLWMFYEVRWFWSGHVVVRPKELWRLTTPVLLNVVRTHFVHGWT